jgi:energy-converting hydrogenase B subunit C
MINFIIELVQSICLIIAAIIILIAAIGILKLDDNMDKVIYVRIHMLGMVDIACVLAMIGLGQFLVAGIYFVLTPFIAHAMANAYYFSEDDRKYESNDELLGRIDDNRYNKLASSENTTIDSEFKFNLENKNISTKSTKNGVIIKEISTDDIENTNLNQERGEKYD